MSEQLITIKIIPDENGGGGMTDHSFTGDIEACVAVAVLKKLATEIQNKMSDAVNLKFDQNSSKAKIEDYLLTLTIGDLYV